MPRITEYPKASAFDAHDVLLKDGANGTKKIEIEDAAEYLSRNATLAVASLRSDFNAAFEVNKPMDLDLYPYDAGRLDSGGVFVSTDDGNKTTKKIELDPGDYTVDFSGMYNDVAVNYVRAVAIYNASDVCTNYLADVSLSTFTVQSTDKYVRINTKYTSATNYSLYKTSSGGNTSAALKADTVVPVDDTLTVAGKPADAKATGDAIAEVKDTLEKQETNLNASFTNGTAYSANSITSIIAPVENESRSGCMIRVHPGCVYAVNYCKFGNAAGNYPAIYFADEFKKMIFTVRAKTPAVDITELVVAPAKSVYMFVNHYLTGTQIVTPSIKQLSNCIYTDIMTDASEELIEYMNAGIKKTKAVDSTSYQATIRSTGIIAVTSYSVYTLYIYPVIAGKKYRLYGEGAYINSGNPIASFSTSLFDGTNDLVTDVLLNGSNSTTTEPTNYDYLFVPESDGYVYIQKYSTQPTIVVYEAEYKAELPVDDTLTVAGKPADAKKVGDEIDDLKNAVDDINETIGIVPNLFQDAEWETGAFNSSGEDINNGNSARVRVRNAGWLDVIDGVTYTVSTTSDYETYIVGMDSQSNVSVIKYDNSSWTESNTFTGSNEITKIRICIRRPNESASTDPDANVSEYVSKVTSTNTESNTGIMKHLSDIDDEIGAINDEISNQNRNYRLYDLSSAEQQPGSCSTAVGQTIAQTPPQDPEAPAWKYVKVDCSAWNYVVVSSIVKTTNAGAHEYVFTDQNDKVLAFGDSTPSDTGIRVTHKDVTVPTDAKWLYIYSYYKIGEALLKYADNETAATVGQITLSNDRARYDNTFMYVGYSASGGIGSSPNTVEAYEWFAKNGYTAIKGDVRPTSDNKLIMCHDADFKLNDNDEIISHDSDTYAQQIVIHDHTYDYCTALTHKNTGNHVCGIDDFLYVCKKYGKVPFITIRDEYIDDVNDVLFAALDRYNMRQDCIINSFELESLENARAHDDRVMLSYVLSSYHPTQEKVDAADMLGNCLVCAFDFKDASPGRNTFDETTDAMIAYAKSKNVRLYEAVLGDISYIPYIDQIIRRGFSGAQIAAEDLFPEET